MSTTKKSSKKSGATKTSKTSKKATKKAAKKAPAKKSVAKKGAATKAKVTKSAAKKPAKKAAKKTANPADAAEAPAKPVKLTGAAKAAAELVESPDASQQVQKLALDMLEGSTTSATQSARVLSEVFNIKEQALVPVIDKLVKGLLSKHKRTQQLAADALPKLARRQPAKVARHLDVLKATFDEASPVGKDGVVRSFANLCTASVAYQKRLEPVLTKALAEAEGKVLLEWSQVVLPALKGEPHANARAVVEGRFDRIPRHIAQAIADQLGIRLRARYR